MTDATHGKRVNRFLWFARLSLTIGDASRDLRLTDEVMFTTNKQSKGEELVAGHDSLGAVLHFPAASGLCPFAYAHR